MSFLPTWWKIAATAALLLTVYGAGWRTAVVLEEARQEKELAAEIAQHQKDQAAANQHATDLEATLAAERQKSASLNQQWSRTRVKSTDCALTPDALQLLRQATGSPRHNPG